MRASKENARQAIKDLRALTIAAKAEKGELPKRLMDFLLAAERKLPSEAAYDNEAIRKELTSG